MKSLVATLLLLIPTSNKVEYFNETGVRQLPVLSDPFYHPQSFEKEFFIPVPKSNVKDIQVSIGVTTRKVMGAGNFSLKTGVISITDIENFITVSVDTCLSKDKLISLERTYLNWAVNLRPQELINSPPEYTKEIGTGSVKDINDLKIYMIEGKPFIKVTVNGDSFYQHSSTLHSFLSSVLYQHDIKGQVIFFY
jgi:hypothetical protein